ncbi:DUF680 domain-containing protein [Mesorhizobium muleiense]|uniref:DUF680 domain-containing protein n=1 Tax=Mesorhizobium muleiense TaxID=1004279 RepID=UPI001F289258|nr:DUF680 domain-containing protein [Mesorhizobium muleiense]MCF6118064.1 DUF680 domain-containing protein [Mesorhizobium muleiense]
MLKIVLATATLLFASGMAFAGSDHYGSDYSHSSFYPKTGHHSMASDNGYAVDPSGTASVDTTDSAPTSAGNSIFDKPAPGYGQGMWGSR